MGSGQGAKFSSPYGDKLQLNYLIFETARILFSSPRGDKLQ